MKEMIIPPDRSFGRTFAFIFCAIAAYFYFFANKLILTLLILAIIFLALAQFTPKILHPLNYIWTLFGFLMSKITNPIFLCLVYFLVITPTGLMLRLFGKDILRLKLNGQEESFWIDKEESRTTQESMKVQF
jgi:hypothetical protein